MSKTYVFTFCLGLDLCLGQPVDPALLNLVQKEVAAIRDEIECWKEDKAYDKVKIFIMIKNFSGLYM